MHAIIDAILQTIQPVLDFVRAAYDVILMLL